MEAPHWDGIACQPWPPAGSRQHAHGIANRDEEIRTGPSSLIFVVLSLITASLFLLPTPQENTSHSRVLLRPASVRLEIIAPWRAPTASTGRRTLRADSRRDSGLALA